MKHYFLSNEERDIHLVFEHVNYQSNEQKKADIQHELNRTKAVQVSTFENVEFELRDFSSNNHLSYTLSDNDKRFYKLDREGLYSYKTTSHHHHILLPNGEKLEGRIYHRSSHVLPEIQLQ